MLKNNIKVADHLTELCKTRVLGSNFEIRQANELAFLSSSFRARTLYCAVLNYQEDETASRSKLLGEDGRIIPATSLSPLFETNQKGCSRSLLFVFVVRRGASRYGCSDFFCNFME